MVTGCQICKCGKIKGNSRKLTPNERDTLNRALRRGMPIKWAVIMLEECFSYKIERHTISRHKKNCLKLSKTPRNLKFKFVI